jgi:hypothetical protein
MRQRRLSYLSRCAGRLADLVPEARTEPVHGEVASLHPAQHHSSRHDGEGASHLGTGEQEGFWTIDGTQLGHVFRTAAAGAERGTRCARPAFMRSAGTVPTLDSRSTSSHRAPSTSPDRVAVRIANSRARAAIPTWRRSAARKLQSPPRVGPRGVALQLPRCAPVAGWLDGHATGPGSRHCATRVLWRSPTQTRSGPHARCGFGLRAPDRFKGGQEPG